MKRHFLFEIPIDDLSQSELQDKLSEWLSSENIEQKIITTPNPEFVTLGLRSHAFRSLLQQSDLALADGVGLRFGISALTDGYLEHRHTGVDVLELLAKLCAKYQRSLVLFGGENASAFEVAKRFKQRYPDLQVHAIEPGFLLGTAREISLPKEIVNELAYLKPDVIAVALGGREGKQERCLFQLKKQMTFRITMGVGGAFESLSHRKPRAPKMLRTLGLEWFWRLLIEPKRFARIATATIRFPSLVISATLKQHRFWKAVVRTIPEMYRQLRNL